MGQLKTKRMLNEKEKQKKVKREIRKLNQLLRSLPEDKRKAAQGLIEESAFMKATLEEARIIIDREGLLEVFEQGAQNFLREHPATKVYNTMIQRYVNVCKQIFDLLPDDDPAKQNAEDELMAFVKRGKR